MKPAHTFFCGLSAHVILVFLQRTSFFRGSLVPLFNEGPHQLKVLCIGPWHVVLSHPSEDATKQELVSPQMLTMHEVRED